MRILFLTAELPEPAHAGGTLRTNGLMRAIHGAGHEIHVLSFATPEHLGAHREALAEFCARIEIVPPPKRTMAQRLRDLLFTDKADMQGRFFSPLYQQALVRLMSEVRYDLVQMESLEMTIYGPVVRQYQPHTPLIYDSFNAEFDLQRTIYEAERGRIQQLPGALYSRIQWRRLTRYERQVVETATHTLAVSDADAAAFRKLVPGRPVSVVPNGINFQQYATPDTTLDLGRNALVFTGSMSYRPNVDAALWFAGQVLQRIREVVPDVTFFIVGSRPHRRLSALREREHIHITGWVPDVNPFLHAATVYIAPLRMGSGTRLKLLQAMAARRAIVSTDIGVQGLAVEDNVHLKLANDAGEFAQAVIDLLRDDELRANLGERAASYVAEHYDWSAIAPRILAVYDGIMAGSAARLPEGKQA